MNVADLFSCIPLTYALRTAHYLTPCRLSLPMNEHLIQPPVFASSLTDTGPLHGGVVLVSTTTPSRHHPAQVSRAAR
jgi:hypothetical protein